MRLHISKTKNAMSLYMIKSFRDNGINTTKIVKKLGTYQELKKEHDDPIAWANEYIKKCNEQEKQKEAAVLVKYSPVTVIAKDVTNCFNGGYLFLQKIYQGLKLDTICYDIADRHRFEFNLDAILSRLLFARLIFPSSKLATYELSKKFIQPPDFELHHIYRALEVISKESDYIQSEIYKNSLAVCNRNTEILYYDVTNYFFEIEKEEGLKQYGFSKEHRPNPIVQMGLFMDAGGMPLAFNISAGNTNEQTTLIPLEEKILKDFKLSNFVVCTDAGLSSYVNREFNDITDKEAPNKRFFITTQSIKKLKEHLKDWALEKTGWKIVGSDRLYNISEETDPEKIFYKERWINEKELSQKLIVTFSIKYRDYQAKIRANQINRAQATIDKNKVDTQPQTSHKRLIKKVYCTVEGEVAKKTKHSIDTKLIEEESEYDGFYGVCTNMNEPVSRIIEINRKRWEVEESFMIMKSEFKARPVYLSRDDRIKAHFMTCFLTLLLYRVLEKKLDNKFTHRQIIDTLRNMNFNKVRGEGYIPVYTRTDLTDALHEKFGFRTDYQILKEEKLKHITTKSN